MYRRLTTVGADAADCECCTAPYLTGINQKQRSNPTFCSREDGMDTIKCIASLSIQQSIIKKSSATRTISLCTVAMPLSFNSIWDDSIIDTRETATLEMATDLLT